MASTAQSQRLNSAQEAKFLMQAPIGSGTESVSRDIEGISVAETVADLGQGHVQAPIFSAEALSDRPTPDFLEISAFASASEDHPHDEEGTVRRGNFLPHRLNANDLSEKRLSDNSGFATAQPVSVLQILESNSLRANQISSSVPPTDLAEPSKGALSSPAKEPSKVSQ